MDDAIPRGAMPPPNNMEAFWMPFSANRQFKKNPRLLVGAEGMHYHTHDGRQVLDGTAGLWCVNAGHKAPRIVKAIQEQAAELDYAPPFQMGHPQGLRPGGAADGHDAGRPGSCVLHQFRLGIRRHGAQDRARLSQCHRQWQPGPG